MRSNAPEEILAATSSSNISDGTSTESITILRRKVVRWFRRNARTYPWRETRDPWRVLVAEMMLQRTKADQVEGVYNEFFRKFDTPENVAGSNATTLRRILSPLGLNWRFANFQAVARSLVELYSGKVPVTREELTALPGVGDYVAGAILSVAFGKREWIVDSNVVRVLSRFLGRDFGNEARRNKDMILVAKSYANCRNPRVANLALLDFSAIVCTPRHPRCKSCPVSSCCSYRFPPNGQRNVQ